MTVIMEHCEERKRVASSVWKTLWLKGIQGFPVLIWAYKTSRKATSLDRGFPCSRTRDFQVSKGLTRRLEVPDGKAESTGAESGEELQQYYNSQDMEATRKSIKRCVAKEELVHVQMEY